MAAIGPIDVMTSSSASRASSIQVVHLACTVCTSRGRRDRLIVYGVVLDPGYLRGVFERASASCVHPCDFFLEQTNIDKTIRGGSFVGF
jgi:hypothetical protein